ncbi:MAG: heavy metal transporter [Arcobacter sp.]|nr:heavy metal transporter [Arcobacter sp.]
MKQTFEVENVKCGGCANTLISSLKEEFGEVLVDLDVYPRKITLELEEEKREALKLKLRALGYPLSSDELSSLQKATTTAKSFVSCAIGKVNVATGKTD